MTIISVLNQKGGVGKTTIAVSIACQLHKEGFKVLLVDIDQQQSASDWSAAQGDNETFPVIQMNKNISRDLPSVGKSYDWVIIDGAPQVAELSTAALKASDIVLIPCQASPLDIWACADFVDVVKTRQDITDGKLKAAFIVSMAVKGTKLSNEVSSALAEYDLPVFTSRTTRSVSYQEQF